ncbi:MAG: type II toxin-antitoxin system prevent-host-death family antitoxin [Candidatus Binatia bacterium]
MSKWTIAEARRRFSELLNDVVREPQPIYRRSRRVAAVIRADELEAFEAWRQREQRRSLADDFRELREVRNDDAPAFDAPVRGDRPDPFTRKRG